MEEEKDELVWLLFGKNGKNLCPLDWMKQAEASTDTKNGPFKHNLLSFVKYSTFKFDLFDVLSTVLNLSYIYLSSKSVSAG